MKVRGPFISAHSTVSVLHSLPAPRPSPTQRDLNEKVIVIWPEFQRAKGLQSVGLEQQQKAALVALQSQIDVVQCEAAGRSVKHFSPIWTTSLKS